MELEKIHSRLTKVERFLTVLILVSIFINSLPFFLVIIALLIILFIAQIAIIRHLK